MIQYDEARMNETAALVMEYGKLNVMEAVDKVLDEAVAIIDEMYLPFRDDTARAEWKRWMKERAGLIKPEPPKEEPRAVKPIPCKTVDGKPTREMTVKAHIAKIDEELNELKGSIYRSFGDGDIAHEVYSNQWTNTSAARGIAEEAADTVTAITTALEAIGITEDMRDKAQEAVNERNKKRGRI